MENCSSITDNTDFKQCLFNRVLGIYQDFFLYENILAYVEGRDYSTIQAIYNVLIEILNKDSLNDFEKLNESVDVLKSMVDDIKSKGYKNYPNLFHDHPNCDYSPVIVKIDCDDVFSQHGKYIAQTLLAFVTWKKIFKFTKSDSSKLLLIEFNNYLSHLVSTETKSERGLGHLNRLILDLYKDIVKHNMLKILASKERTKLYSEIRCLETKLIGASLEDKFEIINKYKELVLFK